MRKIIYILILCAVPFVSFGQVQREQSVPLDYDTCARLKEWMYNDTFSKEEAKMKYDTLRTFIEKCAAIDPKSYMVFNSIDDAVTRYSSDTLRYESYREWLISVLYLNTTDPAYYCNVLGSISGTYQYGKYYPTLAYLAVLDYMRKYTNCTGKGHDKEFTKDSLDAVNQGYDPTHLPPLDSLGLGFLLKLDVPKDKPALSSVYLGSASVAPNPMTGSTTLKYELLRSGFIGYTIHDALGNQVFARKSDFADAGKHEEQITLPPSLSSGTYYLRLKVGFGEIRTIRMVVVK